MSSNLSSGAKNNNPNPRKGSVAPPQIRNKPARGLSARPTPPAIQAPTPPPAPTVTFPSDETSPSTFMAPDAVPSFKQGGLVRRGYGRARGV